MRTRPSGATSWTRPAAAAISRSSRTRRSRRCTATASSRRCRRPGGASSRSSCPTASASRTRRCSRRSTTRCSRRRFDRGVTVVALGGGVVGDVAGFAAATYQRGVRFLQVPTTLLAQVDSSVGGKTGINHRLGKNMIGAFHQPRGVVVDLSTLDTLPAREYAAGARRGRQVRREPRRDVLRAGSKRTMPALVARERVALAAAIRRACELKADVVGEDERESGRRALLNFGHTFGHAIEGATGYGTWLHGEAVAAGMVIAARLSARLGLVDDAFADRARRAARGRRPAGRAAGAVGRRVAALDGERQEVRRRTAALRAARRARAARSVAPVDDAALAALLRDHGAPRGSPTGSPRAPSSASASAASSAPSIAPSPAASSTTSTA